ncbi:MAG: hypothetical protein PHE56_10955, partial [Bacteroidales bacterium]|nr:hypothetical protein [Bacteroidales bacterium]
MSKIKHLIKRLIPQRIWGFLAFNKFTLKYFKYFKYDFNRYSKHSAAFFQTDNPEKYLNLISVYTHILEKGLVMPDMRIGFGQVKVLGIIKICEEYFARYQRLDQRLISCIAVIKEYQQLHNEK